MQRFKGISRTLCFDHGCFPRLGMLTNTQFLFRLTEQTSPSHSIKNCLEPVFTVFPKCNCRPLGLIVTYYALWQMQALFGLYRSGDTLTAGCAKRILKIGQGIIMVGVVSFVSKTLAVLGITMGNPPGQRILLISFGDGDVGFV